MSKEETGIDFTPIGEARPLARHRLRFNTPADFQEVLRRSRGGGWIYFSSKGKNNLVGRIIRVADEMLTIEVDAAEDVPGGDPSIQWNRESTAGDEAPCESAAFSQFESFFKHLSPLTSWNAFDFERRGIHTTERDAERIELEGERAERIQKYFIKYLAMLLVIFTLVMVPLANNYCYWHYPFTGSLKCKEESSSRE